ncbi:MAG: GNAT family N-acetyltransferase [Bacteroidota bacterium]
MEIRVYHCSHLPEVLNLSVRAWEPVFTSIRNQLPANVYAFFYPEGWESSQRTVVEKACKNPDLEVWVAEIENIPAGFVAIKPDEESKMGEIYLIAVDPVHQGNGIAKALGDFALKRLKDLGMEVVMVETGGDPCHAAARKTYEKLGFQLLPIARYFQHV